MAYKLSDYENMDFIEIQNGEMIWQGYFYNEGEGGRLVEYSRFSMPIKDFIGKYDSDNCRVYNEFGAQFTQYITDYSEDDDIEWENDLKKWVKGATPIKAKDITENTPDGSYVLMEG